jgi:oligopeptide transport system permease protein
MPPLLRRALVGLLEMVPVLWAVLTITFFVARLIPGGPFDQEHNTTPEAAAAKNAYYGLDQPLSVQYVKYLWNFAHGDLGPSFQHPGWTVNELLLQKAPISAELGLWALLVALIIGIPAGVIAAARPRTWSDYLPMSLSMLGICLPTFVLGPLLILVFGLKLDWVNVNGWYTPADRILPAFVLGLYYAAFLARLTRGSLLEARTQDYVRTARAKGCSPARVLFVHALRNALAPVVAFLGPTIAGLVTGSFVVESIFQIPGIGRLFVEAALAKEYTLLLGVTVLFATLLLVCNWLADLLLSWLNPKVRLE